MGSVVPTPAKNVTLQAAFPAPTRIQPTNSQPQLLRGMPSLRSKDAWVFTKSLPSITEQINDKEQSPPPLRKTWPNLIPTEETTPPCDKDREILFLKQEIAHLQDENRLLKVKNFNHVSQEFLVGAPITVKVPSRLEPVFKKAEVEVAHFFQQKVEDPESATIGIMRDVALIVKRVCKCS